MNTVYEIQAIHRDRSDWLVDLQQAVAAELMSIGLHRTVAVTVGEVPPSPNKPSVAVFLGSSAAAADAGASAAVERAFSAGRTVIPVVDDLGNYASQVPVSLAPVNGFGWTGTDAPLKLARLLLEQLGIEDQQRRVFISHKREDGLGAAEQLHDSLSHAGFVPFIDRFAIRTAAHVQEAIADALEDHAFLLLLETPLAHTSDWVFDEVDYALSHTMGTLIVRWPGEPPKVPGSPGLPRLALTAGQVTTDDHGYSVLTEPAIDHVVGAVEAAHAHGLVRRRRMLIRSIEEAAAAASATTVPLPDWRLLVTHNGDSTLVGVTPRLPTAEDLQFLDDARMAARHDPSAVLVHSARVLREDRAAHLKWVAGDRDLELTPENAIGRRWT